jgi:hypothetical protein
MPPIVVKQRLGKNPLIAAKQRIDKNPPIVVRQRLGRNVIAVTNTHATTEEFLDESFSMWPVPYYRVVKPTFLAWRYKILVFILRRCQQSRMVEWLIKWKEFWTKHSCYNAGTILKFAGKDWEKSRKPSEMTSGVPTEHNSAAVKVKPVGEPGYFFASWWRTPLRHPPQSYYWPIDSIFNKLPLFMRQWKEENAVLYPVEVPPS